MTSDDLGLPQSPAQAAEGDVRKALKALIKATQEFHEAATSHFNDSDYDFDLFLAKAEAELSVTALPDAVAALSADAAGTIAAARLAAEEMRERAEEAEWRPASEAPNGWHRTYRLGEDGATWSHCWTDKFGDREWSDPQGRTTVTHGTYAPPTHYLAVKAPPLPLPPSSSPEDQEKAKAAAVPTIADPVKEGGQ